MINLFINHPIMGVLLFKSRRLQCYSNQFSSNKGRLRSVPDESLILHNSTRARTQTLKAKGLATQSVTAQTVKKADRPAAGMSLNGCRCMSLLYSWK
ncbi:hypothetical protein K435DRAFT_423898 [Dendrothele bispora CBS 962.96]|uniref:Uncharacterized protein n=1 Tax=Dendrothele bispora (strain CBS 962.96) TaxID=1314807 RepID=A0A4S8L515_DENBC|nr:hypothetical protein K435DRAFT_423898 [Dendrothele bispora CBS 962.96]